MTTFHRPHSSLGIHTARKGERRASTGDHLAPTRVSEVPRKCTACSHAPDQTSSCQHQHQQQPINIIRGRALDKTVTSSRTASRSRTPLATTTSRSPFPRQSTDRAATPDFLGTSPATAAIKAEARTRPRTGSESTALSGTPAAILRGRALDNTASPRSASRSRTPLNQASRSPLPRRSADRATPDILEASPVISSSLAAKNRPRTGSDSGALTGTLSRSSSITRITRRSSNTGEESPKAGASEKPRWVGAWSSSTRSSTTTSSKHDASQNKEHSDHPHVTNSSSNTTIPRSPLATVTKPAPRRLSLASNSSTSSSCTTMSSVSCSSISSISSNGSTTKDQSKAPFRKPDFSNVSGIKTNKVRTAPNSPSLRAVPSTSGETSAREPANQQKKLGGNTRGRSDSITGTMAARPAIQSNVGSNRTKLQESLTKTNDCKTPTSNTRTKSLTTTMTNRPQGKEVQRGPEPVGQDGHGELDSIVVTDQNAQQPGVKEEERSLEKKTTTAEVTSMSPALIRRLFGDTATSTAAPVPADKASGSTSEQEDHTVVSVAVATETKSYHPFHAPVVAVAQDMATATFFDPQDDVSVSSLTEDRNEDEAAEEAGPSSPLASHPMNFSRPSSRASSVMSISAHEAMSRIMEQQGSRRRSFGGRVAELLISSQQSSPRRMSRSAYSISEGVGPAQIRVSSIESFPDHDLPPANEKLQFFKGLFKGSFLGSSTTAKAEVVTNNA